jgi:radical SAM superfamily enzyme YgiQ (UPF0313 family)
MNPLALTEVRQRWFNRYRVWKPLGLMTLAALTPGDWEIEIVDENLGVRDYAKMPRPDLVGITAFTSQASRAYELAAQFRAMRVPVVMGGIHASMCTDEALAHVDSVVVGEAEGIWPQVLDDARRRLLDKQYQASSPGAMMIPPARHDLLSHGYGFGAVQTTRGCPLNCSFCSVTAFNGARYRHRPIPDVIAEMRALREKFVLVVDDNLIGISVAHLNRAKDLFRAMIAAKLKKKWIAQVTINMGDDEELLSLAAAAGCVGVFVGFESPTAQGLAEVGKKFNTVRGRDMAAAVRRIQRQRILVVGSFIIGLDTDGPGIGRRIAEAGTRYGVDMLNVLFLTPLPGTRLWNRMSDEDRILARDYPHDWRYYTLTFPVAKYHQLSQAEIIAEMESCDGTFYSPGRVTMRVLRATARRRVLVSLIGNLSYRSSLRSNRDAYRAFAARSATAHLPVPGALKLRPPSPWRRNCL